MTKYIGMTKSILETFLEESGINDRIQMGNEKARIQAYITRARFANISRAKIAEELNYSVEAIGKYIAAIKALYDKTQEYSIRLPKRGFR